MLEDTQTSKMDGMKHPILDDLHVQNHPDLADFNHFSVLEEKTAIYHPNLDDFSHFQFYRGENRHIIISDDISQYWQIIHILKICVDHESIISESRYGASPLDTCLLYMNQH